MNFFDLCWNLDRAGFADGLGLECFPQFIEKRVSCLLISTFEEAKNKFPNLWSKFRECSKSQKETNTKLCLTWEQHESGKTFLPYSTAPNPTIFVRIQIVVTFLLVSIVEPSYFWLTSAFSISILQKRFIVLILSQCSKKIVKHKQSQVIK